MRTFALIFLLLLTAAPVWAQDQGQPAAAELKTTRDQASYAIGMNIGQDIVANGMQLNADALLQGLRDALAGAEPRLSEEQARAALTEFQQQVQAQMEQQRRSLGEKNKREGEAFLAKNKQQEGVVTLPSGLQYKVIKSGDGPSPGVSDTVRTHYHGTLIDGTVFDSSVERKEPAEFPVGGVIRGWTEALQKMKVGDKWRLFVPPDLAYGARGAGNTIGPNAVLIFDVELLEIK